MHRFYIENTDLNKNILTEILTIENIDIVNKITKVLRLKTGDEIVLFGDINNYDFLYKITETNKKQIKLELIKKIENNSELNININLIQALPNKLDKIEDILKKGTQIGIKNFLFFKSKRSQNLKLSDNKLKRLNNIIKEALEQSGRISKPELIILEENILLNKNLNNKLNTESEKNNINTKSSIKNIFLSKNIKNKNSLNLIFHTKSDSSKLLKNLDYSKIAENYQNINLIVGPEGGFDEEEINDNIFINSNLDYNKIHLGNRVLRTETTGIVSSFYIIQSL